MIRRLALRIARSLASPIGVLVTVPLLVIAIGAVILLVGRSTSIDATHELAQSQLDEQAASADADVRFALEQAGPIMERLKVLADPSRPIDDVLVRLHDLLLGRAGVAYLSISFADGTFRGAYVGAGKRVEVQESRVGPERTTVRRFVIADGGLRELPSDPNEPTTYDPRTRSFYKLAELHGTRVWTEPYAFYKTGDTGITCAEPILISGSHPSAVVTVDFDIRSLSSYVTRHGIANAQSLMFAYDTNHPDQSPVLAYSDVVAKHDRMLRPADLGDGAVSALFTKLPGVIGRLDARKPTDHFAEFVEVDSKGERYLASVARVGGVLDGVASPLAWYVATLVPERSLLGKTASLVAKSVIASAIALAIAVGIAVVLAWNLVRMRRQVAASDAIARTAQARVKELGSYRLVARLGAGGMGEVWRAEHRLLARSAAIKLIRPEALEDPTQVVEMRERFRREAQTLASMRSRHTIAIFDYGVTNEGTFYYVMELLDGLDFEQLVARFGPQPSARVIPMLIQACGSLAEAHDAGLFHRDIKPPNLFVSRVADELDVVKLLDFGIVQSSQDPRSTMKQVIELEAPSRRPSDPRLTQMGTMLGTPGFMAPEQILGTPIDGRADLYALGCCAWWLLAGGEVYPRTGGDTVLLRKHIYDELPSLRARVQGWFPPELEAVIAACLAKEPEQRPANARVLAARLRAIEIPADAGWSEEAARVWWQTYRAPDPVPFVASGEVRVVVPGGTDSRDAATTIRHTIED